jgi:hypothetical protein
MRSKSLWLQARDENTIFFHHFANSIKLHNTIWLVDVSEGTKASFFEDITHEGTSHFESLFKVDPRVNIDTIIKVGILLPSFISLEDNKKLMEEIMKDELERIIHNFQKDTIMGLDGFPIDFYKGCFEFISEDLLNMFEYLRNFGHIHV